MIDFTVNRSKDNSLLLLRLKVSGVYRSTGEQWGTELGPRRFCVTMAVREQKLNQLEYSEHKSFFALQRGHKSNQLIHLDGLENFEARKIDRLHLFYSAILVCTVRSSYQ